MNKVFKLIAILALLMAAGCVSRPPSIAHVHLGHALTAVHVTPNREGYLVVARSRAEQAHAAAQKAHDSTTLEDKKSNIVAALLATSSEDDFGLQQSVVLAANHVAFAATSEDASANVQQSAPVFTHDIARVVERCELISLLAKDVTASTSTQEASISVDEILKLTLANIEGDDADGDGKRGTAPAEFGVTQLRSEFDGLIAREMPAYRTVDQWYLFNLVRLPSGRWVFDKLSRGGNIEGYK
jgi:hypothetical protein